MRHKRENRLGRAYSVSNDNGANFSPIYYNFDLKGPVCQANAVTGYKPNVIYFSNPYSIEGFGRKP